MDTHLVNRAEDHSPPPESVDLQQSLGGDSHPPPTETLDDVENSFTVPDVSVNFQDTVDPSDSSLYLKDYEEEPEQENLICPSPINSYSGWSSFDNVNSLTSCFSNKRSRPSSPFWFDDKPSMVGAGLSNLGNTCFLNAVVQCFTHTVPLVEGLLSYDHVTPCDRNINGFCLLCAFRGHIEISLTSIERAISPWKFVDNLSYFSSGFQRYQQEDAHEFLQCFLDRLESSCSDSKLNETTSCAKNDNFVKQAFGGRLVSKLKCCNCGYFSDTYEPCIDLSLEIEDVTTLHAALESFTKLEKIEDLETKFMCENCKEEVSVEKQLILEETPSIAAFHLKRFKNDGSYVEKIDKFVEFPLELDLQPYTKSSQNSDVEVKYELYAIVVHNGFSATSGHYYCFIRSAPDTWYRFDDSKVVRVQEEFVLSQDAYILFYSKQGISLFSSYLETIKPLLDPHGSNTSPKSVLDNLDIRTSSPNHETKCNYNETSNNAHENPLESHSVSRHDPVDGIIYKDDILGMSTTLPLGTNCPIDNLVDGSKDSDDTPRVSTTSPPRTSIPMKDNGNGMKVYSPLVLQEYNLNRDDVKGNANNPLQTPPRSSSSDIFRDESPEAELYIKPDHHKLGKQVSNKKQLKKELESSETKEAQRLLRTFPSGRRKTLLAAMAGPMSEDTQRNKRRKRMEVTPNKDDSPSTTHRKADLRSLARPLAAGFFR